MRNLFHPNDAYNDTIYDVVLLPIVLVMAALYVLGRR